MKPYTAANTNVAAGIAQSRSGMMPRYFLHIHHKHTTLVDHEGSVYDDLSCVRREVVDSARQIMASKILQGYLPTASTFSIVDAKGEVVLNIPFSEAYTTD